MLVYMLFQSEHEASRRVKSLYHYISYVCRSSFYYVCVAVLILVCVSLSADTSIHVSQSEHEASRRVKSEVLSQMDGINKSLDGEHKLGTQLYSVYWYKSTNTDAAGAASQCARNGEHTLGIQVYLLYWYKSTSTD